VRVAEDVGRGPGPVPPILALGTVYAEGLTGRVSAGQDGSGKDPLPPPSHGRGGPLQGPLTIACAW
jgi:hypothetical protein